MYNGTKHPVCLVSHIILNLWSWKTSLFIESAASSSKNVENNIYLVLCVKTYIIKNLNWWSWFSGLVQMWLFLCFTLENILSFFLTLLVVFFGWCWTESGYLTAFTGLLFSFYLLLVRFWLNQFIIPLYICILIFLTFIWTIFLH